jgi:hypothetical protein
MVSAGAAVHAVAPGNESVPPGHDLQTAADAAPVALELVPGGHRLQKALPGASA